MLKQIRLCDNNHQLRQKKVIILRAQFDNKELTTINVYALNARATSFTI